MELSRALLVVLAAASAPIACSPSPPAPNPSGTTTLAPPAPSSATPPGPRRVLVPSRGPFTKLTISCVRFPSPRGYYEHGKLVESTVAIQVEGQVGDMDAFMQDMSKNETPVLAIGDEI